MQLRKILCAVDFSAASRTALHYAADLAERFGAGLTLLHVYRMPAYPIPDGYVPLQPMVIRESFARIDRALAEWQREAEERGAHPVEAVSLPGSAWSEIVRRADEEGHDLVVLGRHGHSELHDRILGSVAERVVRHAPCPVLMVHQADEHVADRDEPAPAPGP